MKKRNILWIALSITMILAITLAACGGSKDKTPTPAPTSSQTGVVEVRAMDAPPTGVSSIMVTTSNIEVHKSGASEDSWIAVVSQEKTFDLVTIQGAEMFLGQKELEAGKYTQIRLDVTNVKVVLEGKELIAKLPGEKLKVVSPWEVKPGQKTILTLDFDADKFVVITGKDQAQVKPVIKLEVSQGERPLKKSAPTPTPISTPTPTPDDTVPMVSGTINDNGATNVPVNTKAGAFFTEAMDPFTLTNDTFTLKQGTTPVAGTVTYIGVAATFTPAANLAPNTEYTATITTGAKDLSGNALASPYIWRWTTGANPDTTAPMVSSTINANGAKNVPINTKAGAFFSEAMDPLTITTATFTLKHGTTPVAGTVTYVGVAATFIPSANLAPKTEYTVTITTGAKDLAGNALASPYILRWTTGANPDTTAPTVSSAIPANLATGVALNSKITTIFSEVMNPLTLTTATFTLKQGTTPVTGTVTYAGVTATFTPLTALAPSTTYTATITTGAKDLAGNALAVNKVRTFTTGAAPDTIAPTVSSTINANGATDVPINSKISATFSETVDHLTLTTATFTLTQGTTPVAGTVTYVGEAATFTPLSSLAPNTEYTATITTGAKDLAGNALPVNKVWTFTTGAAPETIAPTVSSTLPSDFASGVPTATSEITATFSEAMDPLTVNTATFTLRQGETTPVTGTVTYAGVTATFTLETVLEPSSAYIGTITTGAKDLAGNALAVNKVWQFHTSEVATGAVPGSAKAITAFNFTTPAATGVINGGAKTIALTVPSGTNVTALVPAITITGASVAPLSGLAQNFTSPVSYTVTAANASTQVYTVTVTVASTSAKAITAFNFTTPAVTGVINEGAKTIALTVPFGTNVTALVPAITITGASVAPLSGLAQNFTSPVSYTVTAANASIQVYTVTVTVAATTVASPLPVNLGAASTFAVMATSSISSTGDTQVYGDVGLNPGSSQGIPPPQVHGTIHVIDQPVIDAQASLLAAYNDAVSRSTNAQTLPGNLGGLTFAPGLYVNSTSVLISGAGPGNNVTLDAQGNAGAVFIFKMGSTLTTGPGSQVILAGGAKAANVFWQIGSSATLDTTSIFKGNILAAITITANTGSVVEGRLLAGSTTNGSVTLNACTITVPSP